MPPAPGIVRKREIPDSPNESDAKRVRRAELPDLLRTSILGYYIDVETIFVGPNATPFKVHTNVLRSRCTTFYQELCSNPANYHLNGIIRLPTYDTSLDSVRMWKIFMAWLYSDTLASLETYEQCGHALRDEFGVARFADSIARLVRGDQADNSLWHDSDLVDIFIFAASHNIFDMANLALSTLADQNKRNRRTSTRVAIDKAFTASTEDFSFAKDANAVNRLLDNLRNYLVMEAVWRVHSSDLIRDERYFHENYLFAVGVFSIEVARMPYEETRNVLRQWPRKPCRFHTHGPRQTRLQRFQCKELWRRKAMDLNAVVPLGYQLLEQTTIINVGPYFTPFVVFPRLLSLFSTWFKRLLLADSPCENQISVALPEENPKLFAIFLHFTHTRSIVFPTEDEGEKFQSLIRARSELGDNDEEAPTELDLDEQPPYSFRQVQIPFIRHRKLARLLRIDQIQTDLIDLYIFAHRRQVPILRNIIIDTLIENREAGHPYLCNSPENMQKALAFLPSSSKLWKYLAEEATFCWLNMPVQEIREKRLPGSLLEEVLAVLLDENRMEEPRWRRDVCYFHTHGGEEHAERCREVHREWMRRLTELGSLSEEEAGSC